MMTAKQQSNNKMLSAFLSSIFTLPSEYDVPVKNLVMDSRQINRGDLFVSINNDLDLSRQYIEAAVKAEASAVIWDAQDIDAIPFAWSENNKDVPLIAVNGLKEKLAALAKRFYNHPSEKLNIVAVTGTNGKTSCVNYIAQALDSEQKCGLIGTLGIGVFPNITLNTYTTPDVLTVNKTLADFVVTDIKNVAIEVSSHGLAQGRVDEVDIDIAIFTNLTQDHLDYHETMDAYLKEKIKLFIRPSLHTAIINIADDYGLQVAKAAMAENIVTYNLEDKNNPDVFASDIQYYANTTQFTLNTEQGSVALTSNLIGDFNVSNLLAVCSYLQVMNYSLDEIAKLVENIQPVAGRMEKIEAVGYPLIVVDYAHTPDALEHALKTLQMQFKNKLTCVFGCGGERDKDKRAKMGEVASAYADSIVLTNDNPRTESAELIIKQIILGIADREKVMTEFDRKKAIGNAIKNTSNDGCVLIAGKGHEAYQIIGTEKTSFNDVDVVKELLSL